MIEFRVLGPLQVARGGRALPLGGLKQRGVLALLLLDRNHVVPRDRLIDALWGERPPASAANSVQVYVSKLRRVLEDGASEGSLVTEPPGYALRVPTGALDSDDFEHLLDEGKAALQAGAFVDAETTLASALAIWRGPALADLAAGPMRSPRSPAWRGLRLEALESLFEAMLSVGRQAEAVGELLALVGLHPLDERPAHAVALSLGPPGGGARDVPVVPAAAERGARARAGAAEHSAQGRTVNPSARAAVARASSKHANSVRSSSADRATSADASWTASYARNG